MKLSVKSATVVEALVGLENCTRYGARFVSLSGQDTFYPYQEVLQRAQAAAGTLQVAGLQKGDVVAVVLPTSIEFFDAFLGVQLAGGIPVALYPPFRLGKLEEYFTRLGRMLSKVGARFLLTESQIRRLLGSAAQRAKSLEKVIEAKDLKKGGRCQRVEVDPEEPAFLQFSSGATVEPKAVMVSHTNLIHSLAMMEASLVVQDESEAERGAVCWLPLYHDMGLVGCLYMGLYYPATVTYLGPEIFLSRPARWLQTISRYRAVISPAPHFAYGLCANKIREEEMEDVELSGWRMALNGAEPIDAAVLRDFVGRFARWGFRQEAMTPVYGLAEAGLAVSFSDVNSPPLIIEFDREVLSAEGYAKPGPGRQIVSVGRPLPGVAVEIRDEEGRAAPAGRVGRVMVSGPSITRGYYADPELTARTIRKGWLDTGDLGFFFDCDLYISGRSKDLIIVRGRNYSPQEMEELLLEVEGVRKGCAVAVGTMVEGVGEQIIILAEKDFKTRRLDGEIIAEVKSRILSGLSLIPYHVELLSSGTLPRTSSGKLRRSEALSQFLSGQLVPPEKITGLKLLMELGKSQIAWARFRGEKR